MFKSESSYEWIRLIQIERIMLIQIEWIRPIKLFMHEQVFFICWKNYPYEWTNLIPVSYCSEMFLKIHMVSWIRLFRLKRKILQKVILKDTSLQNMVFFLFQIVLHMNEYGLFTFQYFKTPMCLWIRPFHLYKDFSIWMNERLKLHVCSWISLIQL